MRRSHESSLPLSLRKPVHTKNNIIFPVAIHFKGGKNVSLMMLGRKAQDTWHISHTECATCSVCFGPKWRNNTDTAALLLEGLERIRGLEGAPGHATLKVLGAAQING